MAVQLAVALSGIAAQAIVTQFVQGAPFDRTGWANVAGQIVKAMIDTSRAQESMLQQLGKKIDDIPRREYDEHMAAGRRYLRDVTPQWRTARDRRDMIRDARSEFVRASAIAEVRNDLLRQVTAEVAIAGCWLWVPSLNDVQNTITNARELLEQEVLYSPTAAYTASYTAAYADVLTLARGYGVAPDTTVLTGHTEEVTSVAFSPDGRTLSSGSRDKTVRLWDVAAGRTTSTLTGHTAPVRSVAFSPDGKALASGSWDYTVRLWDVATHRQIGQSLTGHTGSIVSVAFSPDGKTLASGGGFLDGGSGVVDETVRLWDVATHQQIGQSLTGHTGEVVSVAFSPDGKTLASGGGFLDGTVRLWDVATHQQIGQSLTGHTGEVISVAFSPDGRILASGSTDKTVRLWDVATHRQIRQALTGHHGEVRSVAFSPEGKTLASGSTDKTVRLWDVATGRTTTTLTCGAGRLGEVRSVAFSPDGMALASGTLGTWVWSR